jgi:hypothetical protein
MIVAGLIVREDLANLVDWPLQLVDVSRFLPFHY